MIETLLLLMGINFVFFIMYNCMMDNDNVLCLTVGLLSMIFLMVYVAFVIAIYSSDVDFVEYVMLNWVLFPIF